MKNILMTASALSLASGAAMAGGVERSTQSVAILFEQGNYAELSFGFASPDVSGATQVPVGPFPAGAASGDMAPSYTTFSLGYKQALSDRLDVAVIVDQPIGADVDYPGTFGASLYPLAGTTAKLTSTAVTGLVRYKLANQFSVLGGIRGEAVKGVVGIPLVGNYTLETNRDYAFGYVIGAAWERPDIQARVALTYNSEIAHTLESTEFGAVVGTFETIVPQSVNLEFQTGISRKYQLLLMGSIRWVDWSAFQIDPPAYPLPEPLVAYESDRVTYNLGLGKRFNENWSGSVMLGYEPSNGDITGNLGPTDGFTSVTVGAQYTNGNIKVSGGVRYTDVGDATTGIGARFTDNSALGVGVKIGFTF